MHIPVSIREYHRQADGSILTKRIGKSPFLYISHELLELAIMKRSKDGILIIEDETFRIVQPIVWGCLTGYPMSLMMKESIAAQILRWYYRTLDRILPNICRWEAKWRKDFKEGGLLPFWSISGLLARTYITQ